MDGGGAGSGQPATSSDSCQARRGLWTQDAVIFNAPGRRRSPVLRPRQGTCDEAAGTRLPRVHAPAGCGNGAALQITALVSGTGSILHDQPRTKRSPICARGCWPPGSVRWSCAGPLAFAADGRFPSGPAVCQLSARNNVESPGRPGRWGKLAVWRPWLRVEGRGVAMSSLLDGSAQRRAVAGRVEGQAVRPSAEHGRPEVRLTLGAAA